uniref:Cmyb_C domain-containing protein n=1 Tax=Rodentolepis nana TaxID=102285 RepID=A0A0R3TEV6_RODNA
LFHSCEGHKDVLTFNYDAFDEISAAVPVTFKLVLNLVPKPEELIDDRANQGNIFIENAKDVRTKDNQSSPLSNCIESVNIIESRNASIEAIRLSDSLEDIRHIPNRSNLLATSQELEEITRELAQNRSQTFNEYFMDPFGTLTCEQQWSLQTPKKRKAPKRPPPPDPQRVKTLRGSSEMNWNTNCGTSDRCSIDSGTSLHSDSSDLSERSFKRLAMPALKKLKKRIKNVVDMKGHKKASKQSKSLVDAELMPPPNATTVPLSKVAAKSVVFLNATPTKIPPPRPAPPKLTENMEVVDEVRGRQGKTPSGVRSVPTKYFGPQEKYQKLAEKDFSGCRLLIALSSIPITILSKTYFTHKNNWV